MPCMTEASFQSQLHPHVLTVFLELVLWPMTGDFVPFKHVLTSHSFEIRYQKMPAMKRPASKSAEGSGKKAAPGHDVDGRFNQLNFQETSEC